MDNDMKEKLHFIIENYKEDFERINKEERYKWEAIGWYKKHWDVEAEDFAGMLEKAFGKHIIYFRLVCIIRVKH